MDRRQRKSREAIFRAFTELLSEKELSRITVGEIIDRADVGRATFYAHFETKDYLLKELCEELFCHIFDSESEKGSSHKHIFDCDSRESVFLHLLGHLQNNDNGLMTLLSGRNNGLFLRYFKAGLENLVRSQLDLFKNQRNAALPDPLLVNHICTTFVETVRWWANGGMKESYLTVNEYFLLLL